MLCERCNGRIDSDKKCTLCGYDNSQSEYKINYKQNRPQLEYKIDSSIYTKLLIPKATEIKFLMWLAIAANTLFILASSLLYGLITSNLLLTNKVVIIISMILALIQINVCFFIMNLKKWALVAYLGISMIDTVLLFFNAITVINFIIHFFILNFLLIVLRAVILYFVFKHDWNKFS